MEFSDIQLAAALKVGHAMVEADGQTNPAEVEVLFGGLSERLATAEIQEEIERMATRMEFAEMLAILSDMTEGHKRYIAGYLASIMVSDSDIDEMEVRLWRLISNMCGFPKMTVREAVEFWASH